MKVNYQPTGIYNNLLLDSSKMKGDDKKQSKHQNLKKAVKVTVAVGTLASLAALVMHSRHEIALNEKYKDTFEILRKNDPNTLMEGMSGETLEKFTKIVEKFNEYENSFYKKMIDKVSSIQNFFKKHFFNY